MEKQWITNEAGEPLGYEIVPSQQEQQEAHWEAQYDDNGPDGVQCPKCKAKLMAEDAYDHGAQHDHEGCMCWKCNTIID